MALFREFSGFAIDLASRPDGKLKGRGVLEVLAHEDLRIDLLELNVLVTRNLELFGHHARVGHGEGPRPARLRAFARRRQEFQHDVLGMSEPRIVGDAAPDYHRHDSARLEASAHVAQAGHRVLEKLRAEARKTEIMHRLKPMGLYVGCQKGDIADARGARIAPPVFQEAVAAVYRKHRAGRANQARQLDRRIPETATGIDHLVAFAYLQRRKDFLAV